MTFGEDTRAQALEQFLDDMLEAAATLERLTQAPTNEIAGMVSAYAAQIAERARALQALRPGGEG